MAREQKGPKEGESTQAQGSTSLETGRKTETGEAEGITASPSPTSFGTLSPVISYDYLDNNHNLRF